MRAMLLFVIALILPPLSLSAASPAEIAVIVNKQNPTDEVSFDELVDILKYDQQYWKDGKKIYLIMREMGSPEKAVVLRKVYKMGDEEVKKLWLTKIFRGQMSSFPLTVGSNEAVRRFVSQVPTAIGFINASFMDGSIKALRIDEKLPGEEGYVLGKR